MTSFCFELVKPVLTLKIGKNIYSRIILNMFLHFLRWPGQYDIKIRRTLVLYTTQLNKFCIKKIVKWCVIKKKILTHNSWYIHILSQLHAVQKVDVDLKMWYCRHPQGFRRRVSFCNDFYLHCSSFTGFFQILTYHKICFSCFNYWSPRTASKIWLACKFIERWRFFASITFGSKV